MPVSRSIEPATADEKASLARTFVGLCEIESPTGHEREVGQAVRSELECAGLEVYEDDTAAETGAECGNLLVRVAAPPGARTIMMCAHLDTVPLEDSVEVELIDGFYRNRRAAILGADNKAAVAMLIELARRCSAAPPPVGIELLFTTSEETGLRGAKAFDIDALEAEFGYVFDHATPIGELIVAAPTYYRVTASFTGCAAHAGLRPEDGRNAIVAAAKAVTELRLGRLDDTTTTNVGMIEGGTATNVVAERCVVDAEVRSLDDATAGARMREMVDACGWAASECEVDLDTSVEQQFRAYRISEREPVTRLAVAALSDCGIDPVLRSTGGGSDAHAFQARGFSCMNVANGTERNHTADERVGAAALEGMLDVALRIVARAAEV
ncbi:MAG: M20/M25/M40 family metallo-hydrolase [Solirubrobacterales bacterium]